MTFSHRRVFRTLSIPVLFLATGGLLSTHALAEDPDAGKKTGPVETALANTTAQVRADDDMLALLTTLASLDGKAIEKLTPAEARKQPTVADAVKSELTKQGKDTSPTALVPGVTSKDTSVQGAAGMLPATIYTPDGPGPFPIVVYFHGGGWVIADRKVYDGGARGISKEANAIVVSVDYRLAPEHKFPDAWNDALASYRWVAANGKTFNGDPSRLALAGESAGGNLAVATAVAIVKQPGLMRPKAVVSVYPVAQTESLNTESYVENAIAKPLNRAMIKWFTGHLIRSPDDKMDPRLDLIKADLTGLPPVTIVNAQLDPLRSDGSMLEDALKKANVSVERKVYTGVTHEFFGTAAVVGKAKEAQGYVGQRLQAAFKSP